MKKIAIVDYGSGNLFSPGEGGLLIQSCFGSLGRPGPQMPKILIIKYGYKPELGAVYIYLLIQVLVLDMGV